jgi:hypothetical protein
MAISGYLSRRTLRLPTANILLSWIANAFAPEKRLSRVIKSLAKKIFLVVSAIIECVKARTIKK